MMPSGDMDSLKDTTPPSINPLLLLSACFGSLGALKFLFNREDTKAPLMMVPSQAFLDLLYTVDSSTTRKLTVQESSNDVEDGVDHAHALSAAARLLEGVTAEGDTALHVVSTHGESTEFLECATIIFKRDQDLLFVVNKKGDTPLHCAARAGKSQIVSLLIELAGSRNRTHELLRKENVLNETALHDAVRIGNKHVVEILLKADPELANYPKEGTSPLYLAILLEKDVIARTLHDKSNENLSYSGPHGQNALHAAILRGTVMTKVVLEWNNRLTTEGDRDGSTPLHFASSLHGGVPVVYIRFVWHSNIFRNVYYRFPVVYIYICPIWHSNIFREVFEANPAPVYQADNKGLFPIHIAASLGAKGTVRTIVQKCPSSAGLRTAQGQTFLHVAIACGKLSIVSFVCRTTSLDWILNMQDNDGNTALHLAVKAGGIGMFVCLYGNREVNLSLTNNNGETPLDLARRMVRPGMHYSQNIDKLIHMALDLADAKHSGLRWDQIYEKFTDHPKDPDHMIKESEKIKDSSQILGIGSVLIATVAFGATFAVPGGFRADDQKNAGTPILAGRYAFDAFMMANILAFGCSSIATIGLMYSGTPMVDMGIRQANYAASVFLMASSVTSLSAAFALGVYMVLAPVARATAIAICLLSPLGVLFRNFEYLAKCLLLIQPLYVRLRPSQASSILLSRLFGRMIMELWPFIVIFGWATIARKLQSH